MEAIGISLGYVAVQFFSFLIMFLVLRAWVFNPIANMIENRRATIAKSMEDAQEAADARKNAEADARKIMSAAQEEAAQIVRDAAQRAEGVAKDLRAAAEAEAAKIRESARAGLEQERASILSGLRKDVAALSIAAAQKLVGDALDEKRQHALIDEFFSGVKAGKVVVLEDAALAGASAEVTSALPLTDAEKSAVQKDVLAKVGAKDVTFKVDSSILGGLVIRVGDKVLDGSVSGKLEALKGSLR